MATVKSGPIFTSYARFPLPISLGINPNALSGQDTNEDEEAFFSREHHDNVLSKEEREPKADRVMQEVRVRGHFKVKRKYWNEPSYCITRHNTEYDKLGLSFGFRDLTSLLLKVIS